MDDKIKQILDVKISECDYNQLITCYNILSKEMRIVDEKFKELTKSFKKYYISDNYKKCLEIYNQKDELLKYNKKLVSKKHLFVVAIESIDKINKYGNINESLKFDLTKKFDEILSDDFFSNEEPVGKFGNNKFGVTNFDLNDVESTIMNRDSDWKNNSLSDWDELESLAESICKGYYDNCFSGEILDSRLDPYEDWNELDESVNKIILSTGKHVNKEIGKSIGKSSKYIAQKAKNANLPGIKRALGNATKKIGNVTKNLSNKTTKYIKQNKKQLINSTAKGAVAGSASAVAGTAIKKSIQK